MTLGARIKYERQRLGLNQEAFAAIAGASRRAMVKWEKDESAPIVTAVTSWAEAGADALFILTGRRTLDRPDNAVTQIEDQLALIERDLLDPARHKLDGETEDQADERVQVQTVNALTMMLKADAPFLTPSLSERAASLLDIASDPMKLSLYRAADYAQMKRKREQMKERLAGWLDDSPYAPREAVRNLLAMLALEYAVPVKTLIELVEEIHADISDRNVDESKPIGWRP